MRAQIKKPKALLTATIIPLVLFMSGCAVHKVAGEVAGVDVEASTKDGRHDGGSKSSGGSFCPPGQAKKGAC